MTRSKNADKEGVRNKGQRGRTNPAGPVVYGHTASSDGIEEQHAEGEPTDMRDFRVAGGLLDSFTLPFVSASQPYELADGVIRERSVDEAHAIIDKETTAALVYTFPSIIPHQGTAAWISELRLPELRGEQDIADLNAQADSLFTDICRFISDHPDHSIALQAQRQDKTTKLSDLATRLLPAVPTLLPLEYGKDPVASLRQFAKAISVIFDPSLTDSARTAQPQVALQKLVWFPGVSLSGYGMSIAGLRLRKFALTVGEPTKPGEGIVTCDAWHEWAVDHKVREGRHIPVSMSVQHFSGFVPSRTELIRSQIALFTESNASTDFITAWSALINAMMSEMGLGLAYRARVHDFAHFPRVSAAEMPRFSSEPRPQVTMPFMPDRSSRFGPRGQAARGTEVVNAGQRSSATPRPVVEEDFGDGVDF